MVSKKAISALLTGASIATLALAGRASAGTTLSFGTTAVVDWIDDTTFLNIVPTTIVGTFTNDATISPGVFNGPGSLAVHIEPDVEIGEFVNSGDGVIRALNGIIPTDNATATALLIEGDVPLTTNNGLIEARALGVDILFGGDDVSATAYGIVSLPDGGGEKTTIVNNNKIIADARAVAADVLGDATADAVAFGVYQTLFDDGDLARAKTTNNSKIDAYAETDVFAGEEAYGTVGAFGIYQELNDNGPLADKLKAKAVNNDKILAEARARVGAVEDAFVTYAAAIGIDQFVQSDESSSDIGRAVARNSGLISASVNARAAALTYQAVSQGYGAGIQQTVDDAINVSALARNTGDIYVDVVSRAKLLHGTYAGANSTAIGINQDVDAFEGDDPDPETAKATARNTGHIDVATRSVAKGISLRPPPFCCGPGFGVSFARAYGIKQEVDDAPDVMARIRNSGRIDVVAEAKSSFWLGTYLGSFAEAAGGYQEANEGFNSHARFVNSGDVYVGAKATSEFVIHGDEAASWARSGGSVQDVFDSFKGSALFENKADGRVWSSAESNARAKYADARAESVGVGQYVEVENKARALAKNYGELGAWSEADATATYQADARAGDTFGVDQYAEGRDPKARTVNEGSIYASGDAFAEARLGFRALPDDVFEPAEAFASVTYVAGVAQNAEGFGFDTLVSRTLSKNTGTIMADGHAKALGGTFAEARVDGVFGVVQRSDRGLTVFNDVYNSGDIVASGKAVAKVARDEFFPVVFIQPLPLFGPPPPWSTARADGDVFGVSQAADGYIGGGFPFNYGELAENTVDNSELISATLLAKAMGRGDYEATYASAYADATGVDQGAWSARTASNKVDNSGVVVAEARAKSEAWYDSDAHADAIGIDQHADAYFEFDDVAKVPDGSLGKNVVNNSDWVGAYVKAEALGPGGGAATYAYADVDGTGVDQDAFGKTAKNKVSNTSTIQAEAGALSRAWVESDAYADSYGIDQYASYNGAGEIVASLAENTVNNTDWIGANALARAFGKGGGAATYATADASGTGIEQDANGAWKNRNSVDNSGSVYADAVARSRGIYSDARAETDVIDQDAYGFYESELFAAKFAKNTVNNTDWISGSALAKAFGGNNQDAMRADADAEASGVDQDAEYARTTYNKTNNTGTIDASAWSFAEAWYDAESDSDAYGVFQYASGYIGGGLLGYGDLAKNVVNNDGWVSADAYAKATKDNNGFATYADADASATAVQHEVRDAWTMKSKFTNTGWVAATAQAKSKGHWATAYTEAEGYESDFDAGPDGAVGEGYFLNDKDGTIWADAYSNAKGKEFALAEAYAQGVGYDIGDSGPSVPVTLDGVNKGLIYATALAKASAATYEAAAATAFGVAFFTEGMLDGKFKNTSSGLISAIATAKADEGYAWAVGIYDPSAANNMKVVNKGSIYAYAEGPEAAATGIAVAGTFSDFDL
ncbi:hypothetical protein [Bauldia sp.]|uniref:hypothetical protein n=1 Tax=Bauldia sp. TaxID=2575872 RepID=UPI003BAD4E00